MNRITALIVLCMALLLALNTAIAAEQEETVTIDIPEPTRFVSEHSGRFNGERIDYQAVAGETYIRDLEGEPRASIFTFAYTKTNLTEEEVRPVTFIWNGGPGSSSTWLHMGSYGPKRIVVPSDARHAGLPP